MFKGQNKDPKLRGGVKGRGAIPVESPDPWTRVNVPPCFRLEANIKDDQIIIEAPESSTIEQLEELTFSFEKLVGKLTSAQD